MKNKSFILISITSTIVLLLIILSSTLFSVKKVNIVYVSEQNFNCPDENNILSLFDNNEIYQSIFFINKTKCKNTIQTNFPKISVINIESVFPNILNIYIAKRTYFYAVKYDSGYYICDENLNIIEKCLAFSSTKNNVILLEGLTFEKNEQVGLGMQTEKIDFIKNLSYCLYEWKDTETELQSQISSIEIDHIKKNQISINFFNGVNIIVENANNNLSNKLNYAFSYFDNNNISQGIIKIIETKGKTLLIYKN